MLGPDLYVAGSFSLLMSRLRLDLRKAFLDQPTNHTIYVFQAYVTDGLLLIYLCVVESLRERTMSALVVTVPQYPPK